MDGIAVGRSPTSNALLDYNPRTQQYYEPDSYRLDLYRLPSSVYPSLTYDGGLFCLLYRDDNPSMEELHPPGTRVKRLDPSTNMLIAGTVMDIPLHSNRMVRLCIKCSLIMVPPLPYLWRIWRP